MNTVQARQCYEQYLTHVYIARDLNRMSDFLSENVVAHPCPPEVPPGLLGVKAMAQAWLGGFSELGFTIEAFSQEQDHVTARIVVTGRHTGPFMGLAPTGRRITFVDSSRLRIENGKIAEVWAETDVPGLMRQIS